MAKQFLLIIGFLFSIQVMSQTGIGTATPNVSAKLDVSSSTMGFLPPRVTLTAANTFSPIVGSSSEAAGLLVYNLGSSGLQAGYYYWNGSSWATIATATSAGNGVASMDMVKLYSKTYSAATADSTIANATGYKFTVPVSGRYLFDFSSSGYLNQATMSITFKVRQGTTDLGTDIFTSANNNVHVVFTGMVEVNLQAGITYNVLVSSTGTAVTRDAGDFDRVYYKLVAGNLPVTGQSVDYIQASLSANQALSAVGNINFNTSSGTGITITSGGFNLIANKTYKLEAAIGGQSGGYAYYAWVDNSNNLLPGGSIGAVMKAGEAYSDAPQDKAVVYFTPTVDTRVFLRVYNLSGTLTAYAPSLSRNFASTWASIQQVGSSAIVNPWTLSGTNTFNTTGNVGIGNNAPSTTLDVTGSLGVSGVTTFRTGGGDEGGEIEFGVPQTNTTLSTRVVADVWQNRFRIFDGNTKGVYIDLSKAPTGVGGELLTKASGFVNAGDYVTLGNIRARIPTSGNRSLQVATVTSGTTYSVYGSAVHVFNSNVGSTTIVPLTISTTPVYLNSGNTFNSAGGTDTWNIMDTSNLIGWRISCIIGASYNSNLITIERLF